MPGFDVEAARKAGYSDDEILQHLSQSRNFDVAGALKSGYSKQDIINYLAGSAPPSSEPNKGFFGGRWDYTGKPVVDMMQAYKNMSPGQQLLHSLFPVLTAYEIGKSVLGQSGEHVEKAIDAAKRGDFGSGENSAIVHAMASVPVVGPMAYDITDKMLHGRASEALGNLAGIAGPALMHLAPETVKVNPIVKSLNNPVEQAALDSVENNVRMTVGQKTGQRGLQRVEQGLENYPGSATRAHDFYSGQEQDLANLAKAKAQRLSDVSTNPVEAGKAVQQRLRGRIMNLKSSADQLYDDIRSAAEKDKRILTYETRVQNPEGKSVILFDATGSPLPERPATVYVDKEYESPVDIRPIKTALKPIYKDLLESMPEARRQASPAFTALHNLMQREEPYMNAVDFDRSLGAIKAIARDGKNPYLTTQSQALAKKIVKEGEGQLEQALKISGGQELVDDLYKARKLVKSYHDTAEFLADLEHEPAALFQDLVTGGDRVYNTLVQLKKWAPDELKTVARTFLEQLIDKATAEGGFRRTDSVYSAWERLGPETKKMLFGQQLTNDLDNFFLAAKKLKVRHNPSGTASAISSAKGYGSIPAAALALFLGHPQLAASAAAYGVALPNLASRMLMTPGGARLLTKTLNVPVMTPGLENALNAFSARFLAQGENNANQPQ